MHFGRAKTRRSRPLKKSAHAHEYKYEHIYTRTFVTIKCRCPKRSSTNQSQNEVSAKQKLKNGIHVCQKRGKDGKSRARHTYESMQSKRQV